MYYEVFSEELWCEDMGDYKAYGVLVRDRDDNVRLKISDVFTDKGRADNFVERCNCLELDIVHIFDVIEDEIG